MPHKQSKIDPKVLKDVLDYNPDTGALTWKKRPVSMFREGTYPTERSAQKWNTKYAGKPAFTSFDDGGYHAGSVLGEIHKAHRVIWALVHGYWPKEEVDHINGTRSDNKLINLREVSSAVNGRNTALSKNNKSGYSGISWHQNSQTWRVCICKKNFGKFNNIEDAVIARRKAMAAIGGFTDRHGELKP